MSVGGTIVRGIAKAGKRARRTWRGMLSLSQRLVVYLLVQTFLMIIGVLVLVLGNGKVGVAIGTSLVAASAAGYALFGYVLITDRWSRRVESLLDAGLRDVWLVRSVQIRSDYDRRLEAARESIDLIGFGQRSFREDHIDDIPAWLAHGVEVRLLLLDPRFPSTEFSYADQRDREEGSGSIAADVDTFLREIKTRSLHEQDRFSVRLFRCLPVLNLFRIDDDLFWGPYLVKKPSRNSPTVLTVRGGPLFKVLLGHFEDIWSEADLSVAVDWDEVGDA
jgi:hypothetical protein